MSGIGATFDKELRQRIFVLYGERDDGYEFTLTTSQSTLYVGDILHLTGSLRYGGNPIGNAYIKIHKDNTLLTTTTTEQDGTFTKDIENLQSGTYIFRAVYNNEQSNIVTVNVYESVHRIVLTTSDVIKSYRDSTQFIATVTKNSEPYGVGENVTFVRGGVNYPRTIGSDGKAKINLNMDVGTYTITTTFGGLTNTNTITVNKASTTTTLTASSSSILTTDSLTLTGAVTGNSIGDNVSVKIYDGATLVDTVSESGGSYSKTLTGLSVGTHTFKAVYEGGTNWNSSESSTVTVTVTEPTPVHDYALSVVSSKDILSYADSESATVTATLTDNGLVVSGETLSYTVKHGATTIDSGSDTTDNNGEISFTYTSTGVGDVTIEVDYSSLLQETYELEDCFAYITSEINTTSSDRYLTIADLSNKTLPSKFTLTMDYKTNYEGRCGLFNKSTFTGNPNYSVFVGTPSTNISGSNWYYGYRTTSTSTSDISGIITDYHTFTIERDGNTFRYTKDGGGNYSKSINWFDSYNYVIGLMIFTTDSSRESKVKNIKLKAL